MTGKLDSSSVSNLFTAMNCFSFFHVALAMTSCMSQESSATHSLCLCLGGLPLSSSDWTLYWSVCLFSNTWHSEKQKILTDPTIRLRWVHSGIFHHLRLGNPACNSSSVLCFGKGAQGKSCQRAWSILKSTPGLSRPAAKLSLDCRGQERSHGKGRDTAPPGCQDSFHCSMLKWPR